MVLSDFAADMRQIVDAEAFGVVLARPENRAKLITRHRSGANAHLPPAGRLIWPLLPSIDTATVVTSLSTHPDAAHAVFERLRRYLIDTLVVVPLSERLGILWVGVRGSYAFAPAMVGAIEALAERIVAAIKAPEPRGERLARLARVDAVDQMASVIASSLDVREVFHRLSAVARSVLPHDGATIQILSDDLRHARLLAMDGIPREVVPDVFATNYAPVFNENFLFSLHDDLLASDAERERPTAKAGMRSAIRLPLRFGGRVGGAIEFSAAACGAFRETDYSAARRIADYVTLAVSHQRMSDEARRAAALQARTDQLLELEDLLVALSGVLDLREVFDRVSVVAQKALPHDAMGVTRILPGDRIAVHAVSGFGADFPETFEAPIPEPSLITEPWDFRIIDDMSLDPRYANSPTARAGMRTVLGLPVRLEGRLFGGVNFYSRTPGRFTDDDVPVGRRIANHLTLALSHEQLANEARVAADLSARSANLELLDELLATLTNQGGLAEQFDRISAIAAKVLPHDALVVPVMLPDGAHARVHATAGIGAAAPPVIPVPEEFKAADFQYEIVDDAALRSEPRDVSMTSLGFRSVLRVPIRLDGRLAAGVAFLSKTPGTYKPHDVPLARRIADQFALTLQGDQALDADRRAEEAAARAQQLEARVRALTEELDARTGFRRVIGASASWTQAVTQATQVAATDTTVLLLGESGTGKEVIARFLHRASHRQDGPFVALNCAALPEHLLEAELFGFERGAFTGATQSKPGQLEQAAGGTLFLDEVGEMALAAQAKFLRVLQEREFQRLGGTRVLKTDARIVAATNRDLQQAIARGQFREDLFYRLNVFAIRLPPLRDRRDDVLPLSDAFLAEFGKTLGRPPAGISRDARQRLVDYHWPGNVRELRNILERAAILCDGGLITADHLSLGAPIAAPSAAPPVAPPPSALPVPSDAPMPQLPRGGSDLASMERAMIEQALQKARFNKSKAAAALGLTRAQLYVRMRRYGLE
jgi:transcriptional regulator with GAF, ATPase, and Fis domain